MKAPPATRSPTALDLRPPPVFEFDAEDPTPEVAVAEAADPDFAPDCEVDVAVPVVKTADEERSDPDVLTFSSTYAFPPGW